MGIFRLVPLLLAFLGWASTASAVDQPVLSGMIQRGSNVSSFTLTVKIGSVEKFALLTGETDLFKSRIRVYINGKSDAVPVQGDQPIAAMPFYMSQSSDLQITNHASNANLRDFTYTILITANSYTDFKTYLDENGGKSLKITVKYLESGTEVTKKENEVISVSSAVVSSAPEGLTGKGTHKELVIGWSPSATVTWSGQTPSTKPANITLLAIEKSTTITALPAYIFNETADSDSEATDGTCTFNSGFSDGTACVTCSDAKAYLNTEELKKLSSSGVFLVQASPDSGITSISGLENGKAYAVFSYYEPGGLSRSQCVSASPQANTSWSEINGEDDATAEDTKCFIATAAYGTPLHKNLKPLRWFRDRVLLQTNAGQSFVRWYYENGPKAASYVSGSAAIQMLVRGVLWIPVVLISAWMWLAMNMPMTENYLIPLGLAIAVAVLGFRLVRRTRGEW